ncbi:MAG: hypothetical protein KDI36_15710 [Pseudomonadales bacterium]|nr:hypothetical protein [Pseudomonadales bacterium]
MKGWTKADLLLTGLAILLSVSMLGYRGFQQIRYELEADKVAQNILAVADAVKQFHDNTGRWFPKPKETETRMRVYLDPFHETTPDYQGLNQEWLWRENNFGMVLQLVKFSPDFDTSLTRHLFAKPFLNHQPYLRILLDNSPKSLDEMEILFRVQNRLPEGSIANVDDNYYVVDLRRLINVE